MTDRLNDACKGWLELRPGPVMRPTEPTGKPFYCD